MANSLKVRADRDRSAQLINSVTREQAGWRLLSMEARRLKKAERWSCDTEQDELALVVLGGRIKVGSNVGDWEDIGGRADVFSGMPHALYLSTETRLTVECLSDHAEIAVARAPSDEKHAPRLIGPDDCAVELRGGNNASRQINSIIPPGFDCQKLVCVEVYTPGGNWSSYPPHKHDVHIEESGELKEACLEEIYFYKFDRPEGFAFQRVYTDDRSLDEAVVAEDNDIVLIPRGYHPVSAAYGYNCYYLNFLAGSAQSLQARDDRDHAWTKKTWSKMDERVPVVTKESAEKRDSDKESQPCKV